MKQTLIFLLIACSLHAHGPGTEGAFGGKRVLFIGIDGCRADALVSAMERGLAPQMKMLSESSDGLLTRQFYAGGEIGTPTHQSTVSGPGWTSLLTGVWMDKHGVQDIRFLGGVLKSYGLFIV